MLKHIKYFALFTVLVFITPSCKDDYLDRYPLSGPSSASFYSNQDELMLGLMGCYRTLNFESKAQRPWPVIMDVTTDIEWNRSAHALQDIGKGNHASNNSSILVFWREFYQTIGRCNFLLDNIDQLKGKVSPAVYAQSKAEARFIRAISYHYLAELFGGVPLVTKMLTLEEAQVPRAPKKDVVDFVIQELTEAAVDLPVSYSDGNTGRATRGAALGFKARTALYNERWDVAADAAKKVMDLNYHKIHPSFEQLFLYAGEKSTEHMFALQYQKGVIIQATPNFLTSRMAGGVSNEIPPQSMVDSYLASDGLSIDKSPLYDPKEPFKNRDPRLGYTIVVPGSILFGIEFQTEPTKKQVMNYNFTPAKLVNNTDATNAFATYSGYLYKKYCDILDMADDQNSELNHSLMRYAEVLLIYAEAKIEANQIDATVYDAINQVRRRPSVNMPIVTTGKTQAELRSIVRLERKHELAMEGLRLFDIRRWKIAEKVMNMPVLGRIKTEFLSNPPTFDENGTPDYSNVTNASKMRLIETRIFNKDRDYLWPIPSVEITANKALVQNPNW
ncbi:MAG TPA: RagB/SusD family nutrient uptake outer membrane protein [Sphingobacteriaceae bacterium]